MDIEALERGADALTENVRGWESRTIAMICRRIERIGHISPTDARALQNMADIGSDMDAITADMAAVLGQDIKDVQALYDEQLQYAMANKLPLYNFRNIAQVPFAENQHAQAVASAFAKSTAETMLNLSKTKALYLTDIDGVVRPFAGVYQNILDKAVYAVANGMDFYGEMRQTIMQLGGGGVRVNYGSGVTRRLDTVIRQNILWGAKQASIAYDEIMGEELGCDGFEVDYHSNPRPSHEFMGGKMYSLGAAKTVGGKYYPAGSAALRALEDYGCLHDKSTVILGVSEPTMNEEQLQAFKDEDKRLIEYKGIEKTGYEWKQTQRTIETQIRRQKDIANAQKAAGDMAARRMTQVKINYLQAGYDDLVRRVGLQPTAERHSVSGFHRVKTLDQLKDTPPYGIIDSNIGLQNKLNFTVNGRNLFLPQNTQFSSAPVVLAGKFSDNELRIANALSDRYGGVPSEWQKKAAKIESDLYVFDIHWYEISGIQHEAKLGTTPSRK